MRWNIDPSHSTAEFAVRHLMITNVRGRFGKLAGTVEYDPERPELTQIDATIDATSIDTHEDKRDAHLRSPDFFDVEKFPKATFTAKTIKKAGKDKFKVTGPLQLKDVSKDVTFDVTLSPEFPNPFNKAPTRAVQGF